MKLGQILLLLLGTLYLVSFATGVQRWQWSGGRAFLTHDGSWQRVLSLGLAIFCFSWAAGLYRRAIWAWYVGCAVLVLLIAQVFIFQALLPLWSTPATFPGWWSFISQTIFALLISLLLKKWWIPKKHEFQQSVA